MDSKLNHKLKEKDTRWDRIRKKHINNIEVKTETIKKFIEMDFVDKKQLKLLNGECENQVCLDPAIVMDLRHEMFTKKPKIKVTDEKQIALENVKTHNRIVEEKYLENELTKFKTDLKKNRPKIIKTRTKLCLNLSNKMLMDSLDNCENHIQDFYDTSANAFEESNNIIETSLSHVNDFIYKNEKEEYSNIKDEPQIHDESLQNDKCVRFEDSVEVISYSRTESMCSVISNDRESDILSDIIDEITTEVEKNEEISYDLEPLLTEKQNTIDIEIQKQDTNDQTNFKPLSSLPDDILKITKIQLEKIYEEAKSDEEDDTSKATTKSTESNEEQNAIIAELFKPKLPLKEILLRKYFLKWIHFTTLEKFEKQNCNSKSDQINKINAFLNNIRREKARIATNKSVIMNTNNNRQNMVILAKKYKNKIKLQQDIIELQKLKLERQERMIMTLKISKLSEEARKAREDMKNELRSVIRNGDFKNRAKAKTLQLVGNLRDEEDQEFERLQGKSLITPKFLAKMQERALERSIKHEQARQRRLQLEAEREAAKIAAEEAKRLEDEEAKRRRIEALKEKRRQEKLAKIHKEQERQKFIENNRKAQEFCHRKTLSRIGMEGFKRLLKMRKTNQKKAIAHRKHTLKMKVFIAWKLYYIQIWEDKKHLADDLYGTILKRTIFRSWTIYISMERSKYLVAVDWHELKLSEYIFKSWYTSMKFEKIIEEAKSKKAYSHYKWHLKWKVLDRWTRLPQILKLEKETEERRLRWRMKIWELLPDYKPNFEDEI